MKRRVAGLVIALVVLGLLARAGVRAWRVAAARRAVGAQQAPSSRGVAIRPDYSGVTIPPNITPLNFTVLAPGRRYYVEVLGGGGADVRVLSSRSQIRFPMRKWRKLLDGARGGDITIGVHVRGAGGEWQSYAPIVNHVAEEPIDRYLSYRQIPPVYNLWERIRIRQRDLETFHDRPIVDNYLFDYECVNCHSYRQNHTDRMTVGVRSARYGSSTFMAIDGKPLKVGTKFGYTAWHPSGLIVAYSANKVCQFFHASAVEARDVVDLDSELAYFDLRSQQARTDPAIADPDRLETYPAWSPDGRYLYFSSAPIAWEDRNAIPADVYAQCRYDLRRVAYDIDTDTWGPPETVLSADETGKSLLLPRTSSDGRFLLFCMCDYGCFPIYQPSSDLWMMDLKTHEYHRLGINSGRSESWHSWSSNGRWIAFSSKRRDGLLTRTYLSYVGRDGQAHKAFVVPQEDPDFYEGYLWTWSVPELHADPVPVGPNEIANTIISPSQVPVKSPVVLGNRGAGASASGVAPEPWRRAG